MAKTPPTQKATGKAMKPAMFAGKPGGPKMPVKKAAPPKVGKSRAGAKKPAFKDSEL